MLESDKIDAFVNERVFVYDDYGSQAVDAQFAREIHRDLVATRMDVDVLREKLARAENSDEHNFARWQKAEVEKLKADLTATRARIAELERPGMVSVPEEPTEEMIDAPRQIILYSETPGRTLEGLREHLDRSGVDYRAFFPGWAVRDSGHLTKAGIAILVWHAMLAAAKGGK